MPTFVLTVPERAAGPRGVVRDSSITNSRNDKVTRVSTVTELDIMAQGVRSVGVLVEMDKGDGVLVPLTAAEMGGSVTLSGSLDGYGVRELAFQKVDSRSPFLSADLRASRRVRMTGVRGVPGGVRKTTMFDGWLRSGSFDLKPNGAQIVAQEGAALNKLLTYTLAARSYRTRDAIIREICSRNGIRIGTFTWTGVALGGYAFKEINEAGDRTILAFLSEFVAPTGHRVYQEIDPRLSNGFATLNIKKFHPNDTSTRTLTHADIHRMQITPPDANAPNVVRLSAALYPYIGPDLTGTVGPTTTAGVGSSTGLLAVNKQDKTTGVVSAIFPAATATTAPTVITTLVYDGGSLLSSVVEEWGWYTPEIARRIQDGAGVMTHRTDVDAYQYADGLWYVDQTQTYRMKKRTSTTYSYNAAGWLISTFVVIEQYTERETHFAYHNNGAGPELPLVGIYRKDDGTALEPLQTPVASVGFVPEHYLEIYEPWYTSYSTNAGSEVTNVRRMAYPIVSIGGVMRNRVREEALPLIPGMNWYVFGPTASKRYSRFLNDVSTFADIKDYYATVDADTHTVTTIPNLNGYQLTGAIDNATADLTALVNGGGAVVFQTLTVESPRPLGTQLTDSESPQTTSIIMPDLVRIGFNHGHRIQASAESSWCESAAEMETAALEEMRRIAGIGVTIETDVDWEVGEGDVITIPTHPKLGPSPQLLVLSSAWNVDYSSRTQSQTLRCVWYPPEIA